MASKFPVSGPLPDRTLAKYVDLAPISCPTANDSPLRLMTSDTVSLYVGRDLQHFTAHRALLCHKVLFFRKAFCGSFRESTAAEIELIDENPAAFELFMIWLYKGLDAQPTGLNEDGIEIYLRLYAMAEKWCAKDLMRDAVMVLYSWIGSKENGDQCALSKIISFVCAELLSPKLRLFCVRRAMIHGLAGTESAWLDGTFDEYEEFTADFARESLLVLRKIRPRAVEMVDMSMEFFYT